MNLGNIDLNRKDQGRMYLRGYYSTLNDGRGNQEAVHILLDRAVERNDTLDACYWLGRIIAVKELTKWD